MKAGLSRLEKVTKLKALAAECEEKQRMRIPIVPLPRPALPDAAARERAREQLRIADGLLRPSLVDTYGRVPHEERERQCRKVLEHYDASIAADGTVASAYTGRAAVYHELYMFEESVRDSAWAEQLICDSSGPVDIGSLNTALGIGALSKIELGRYEDAQKDLHLAQRLNPDYPGTRKQLDRIRTCLEGYKARSNGDFSKERDERIENFYGFGLSLYELALFDEAGLNPWVAYAKHILNIVNSVEKDVPLTRTRDHYATKRCNTCGANRFHAKIFLCSKCKAAAYCSKECQRMAWKGHKAACKQTASERDDLKLSPLMPAPNCDVPDQPTSATELVDSMAAWCNKHKPALAQAVRAAFNLRENPGANVTKGLRVTVEWVPRAKSTAQRFRMVRAVLLEFSSFGEGLNSKIARQAAEDSGEATKPVAMVTLVCVSCVPTKAICMPVALGSSAFAFDISPNWLDELAARIG